MNQQKTLAEKNILKCFGIYIVIFLFYYLFYGIAGHGSEVKQYMIILQSFYFIVFSFCIYGFYKIRFTKFEFYFLIFLYSLICGFFVRYISWTFLDEPFLGGIDSYTYDSFGQDAFKNNLDYATFTQLILEKGFDIDDLGMAFFIYLSYKVFGVFGGQNFLIILNAFAITGCAWRLNYILEYFNINYKIKKFCVAIYAFLPFLTLTAGVGLKENFFVFVILSSFYFMFKFKEYKNKRYFLYSGLFIFASFFFRIVICAILIITYLVLFLTNEKNKKLFLKLIFIGFIGGFFAIDLILHLLYGISLEQITSGTESRTTNVDQSIGSGGKWFLQIVALFLGPFANFAKFSNYSSPDSTGTLMKGILGFPLLIGLFYSIKNYDLKSYPLLTYFIANATMLVFIARCLDFRYQIVLYPLTLPFIAQALQTKKLNKLFYTYCVFLFIILGFYNYR